MFDQWLNQQPTPIVANSACRDFLTRSPREAQSGFNGVRFTGLPGMFPIGAEKPDAYRANGAGDAAAYALCDLLGGSLAR